MRIFDYLKSLIIDKIFKDIWIKIKNTDLVNGWIYFNHFIKITYTLIKLDLFEFTKRKVVICYKKFQKDADLIISILIDRKLHQDNVIFILIQVKNHLKKLSYKIETILKLISKYIEIDNFKNSKLLYLLLYMQISIDQYNHEILLTRNKNQIPVTFFGLTKKLFKFKNKR